MLTQNKFWTTQQCILPRSSDEYNYIFINIPVFEKE